MGGGRGGRSEGLLKWGGGGGVGAGTFPTNFFKVYHFYISKLLCSLQNCYAFEEKLLFQRDLKNHKFLIEGNS